MNVDWLFVCLFDIEDITIFFCLLLDALLQFYDDLLFDGERKRKSVFVFIYISYKRHKSNRTETNIPIHLPISIFMAYVCWSCGRLHCLECACIFTFHFPSLSSCASAYSTNMCGNFSFFLCSSFTFYWLINVQYWLTHQSSVKTISVRCFCRRCRYCNNHNFHPIQN